MNFEDIRKMKTTKFKDIVRQKCKEIAFAYLMGKRSFKGSEIRYDGIETAEYLMPNNELNIEEKMIIFSIRNRMINIPSNFVSREKNNNKCICEEKENMEHIYECKHLNEKRAEIKFEEIFKNDINNRRKLWRDLKTA